MVLPELDARVRVCVLGSRAMLQWQSVGRWLGFVVQMSVVVLVYAVQERIFQVRDTRRSRWLQGRRQPSLTEFDASSEHLTLHLPPSNGSDTGPN